MLPASLCHQNSWVGSTKTCNISKWLTTPRGGSMERHQTTESTIYFATNYNRVNLDFEAWVARRACAYAKLRFACRLHTWLHMKSCASGARGLNLPPCVHAKRGRKTHIHWWGSYLAGFLAMILFLFFFWAVLAISSVTLGASVRMGYSAIFCPKCNSKRDKHKRWISHHLMLPI